MSTHPDENISLKPSTGNHAGDVVEGRTCRTLNVTRKIYTSETWNRSSLQMTQFSIGTCVFEQICGSPMGSPLSPALCLMVVALLEEVWHRTFQSTLSTMNLTLEGSLITFFGIHAPPIIKIQLLSHSKFSRPNGQAACRARESVIFTVHSGSCSVFS